MAGEKVSEMVDLSSDQCRIGRAATGLTLQELAVSAGVDVAAVAGLEEGRDVSAETSRKVGAALASAGVTFFTAPGGQARMRVMTLDGIIETPVTLVR